MMQLITPTFKQNRIGWVYFGIQLLVLPTLLVLLASKLPWKLSEVHLNILFFLLNFLCVGCIYFRFLVQSFRHAWQNIRLCLTSAIMGFGMYYAGAIVVGVLIQELYPNFQNVNDMTVQIMVRQEFIPMALCTMILVPITEEVLYRALVFGSLYYSKTWVSYTVSTIVFCSIHVAGYLSVYPLGLLALCFLQYVPASLCLAWAYRRSGTIVAPILIHMLVNTIGILAMR